MFAVSLAFFTAIALAGVAAWFSITGLMAIFAALPISIAIMAGVLEVAKLVTASVLYRNWKTIPRLLKVYLSSAIVILMFITSLGIFGYLSKAHIEQSAPVGDNFAKIERIEQRIAREQRSINDAETVIEELDGVIATLIEYDKISGPDGARAVREGQSEERSALKEIIDTSQTSIDEYLDQKAELSAEIRAFETEIGPIKYIAALAYDEPEAHYEEAVRYIILLLIFVFDPLAVLLLITANHIQMQRVPKDDPDPDTEDPDEPEPSIDEVVEEEDELYDTITEAILADPNASDRLRDMVPNRPEWDTMAQATQAAAQQDQEEIIDLLTELEKQNVPNIVDDEIPELVDNSEYPDYDIDENWYFTKKTDEEEAEDPNLVDTAVEDMGYSSFAKLSIEDNETLQHLIDILDHTEEDRQLTPTEYGWRSTAHNILERRSQNNPLLDARISDD